MEALRLSTRLAMVFIATCMIVAGNVRADDRLLAVSPDGSTSIQAGAAAAPSMTVKDYGADGFDVNIGSDGLTLSNFKTEAGEFTRVGWADAAFTDTIGAPRLPVFRKLFAVPAGADVSWSIEEGTAVLVTEVSCGSSLLVEPAQPSIEKTPGAVENAEFKFDKAAYELDAKYLSERVAVTCQGKAGGTEIYLLEIRPVSYNPVAAELTIYPDVAVQVRFNDADTGATSVPPIQNIRKLVLNPTVVPVSRTRDSGNYLIVVGSALQSTIAPFATAKTGQGFDVSTYVPASASNTVIKSYIQGLWGTASQPDYILLVGDTDTIPSWTGSGTDSPQTDLYYACMDGSSDWYPDIPIGRFSARTTTQLQAIIDKVLSYESGSFADPDYTKRAVFMASDDNSSVTEGTHNYVISTYMTPNEIDCVKLYCDTYNATTQQVRDAFNEGRFWGIYSGHGGNNSWADGPPFSTSDVNNLTNANMYSFVCSFACVTGSYTDTECFTETWIRATNKGACAIYGSSVNSLWTEDDILEKRLFDSIYDETDLVDPIVGPIWIETLTRYLAHFGASAEHTRRYFEMYNLMGDPSMRFPGACSDAGTITVDSAKYACEDSIVISVADCGLNLNDALVETVTVNVSSDSDLTGQNVILTETNGSSAQFEGTLAVSGSPGAGELLVVEDDTITAEYIDADDGAGNFNVSVTDTATVDCTPPIISNVQAINIEPRSANVTLDANEPVSLVVHYGTSCGSLTETAGGSVATSPIAGLSGLQDEVTYFYTVEVADEAGNVTTADNGGVCFMFTTPPVPDFFTEIFESADNDLDNQTFMFTPNGSNDFYEGCVEPIDELPTDPTSGTAITFGGDDDDGYQQITLTGGATVQLYGTSYGSFYVGTNGYITFAHGEDSTSESLSTHFSQPAISGLFDDLDPGAAGSVSWKQLADRAVVTWLNVPKFNTTNSNTFQIEMFFDGTIVLSYLDISITEGLAGLSNGGGLDPDYYESDLTTLGNCGPKPPKAYSAQHSTPVNQNLQIGLFATDDGLPEDPGILTYIITSLPEYGVLIDAGASYEITAGDLPYTLINHDNAVVYDPDFWSFESDSFTFVADDGGTIPDESGWSNEALISISIQAPAPELVYEWTLDTDPGWVCDGLWGFGVPLGLGSHNDDPSSGYTGSNVYGYNLYGDYTNNMGEMFLTTTAIDCSALTSVQLKFYRWLGVETSDFDHASIQVSNDGSTWHTVWEHSGNLIADQSWSLQAYDISAYADGEDTVYVRWCMGATDDRTTYPGWNIDDVEIHGIVSCATIVPCDTNGDGFVNGADISGFVGVVLDPDDVTPMVRCAVDVVADGEYDMLDVEELVNVLLGLEG